MYNYLLRWGAHVQQCMKGGQSRKCNMGGQSAFYDSKGGRSTIYCLVRGRDLQFKA